MTISRRGFLTAINLPRKIRRYIFASSRCSAGCFNAHRELNYKYSHHEFARKEYDAAWRELPRWLRWMLMGNGHNNTYDDTGTGKDARDFCR